MKLPLVQSDRYQSRMQNLSRLQWRR